MTKRKSRGLGKGLGALITQPTSVPSSQLRTVPIAQISPNPHQPRTHFDQQDLEDLAASIKEHGLIQPLIVTEVTADQYHLIAGERRWRASQLANLEELPVVVKEATPQEMLELAIIENVQRADLNPLEEALAYQQLRDSFGLTQAEIADRVGKARSTIANIMRLTDLPTEAQDALLRGLITQRHGRAILDAKVTDEERLLILKSVIDQELNVRRTLELIQKYETKTKPKPKQKPKLSPEYKAVETDFRNALGTKVELQKSGKRGKIVIHFESTEDLNDIYDRIVGSQS